MLPNPIYDLTIEAMRVLFILSVPILVAVMVAGAVGGAIQGVTNIPEPAISYSLKLLALVVSVYLFYSDGVDAVLKLVQMGFSS